LDLHLLRNGLDHEVDLAEAVVRGRPVYAPHHRLELRGTLLGGELAALDEFGELALRHVAGLAHARLHELLIDVLEHPRDARRRAAGAGRASRGWRYWSRSPRSPRHRPPRRSANLA